MDRWVDNVYIVIHTYIHTYKLYFLDHCKSKLQPDGPLPLDTSVCIYWKQEILLHKHCAVFPIREVTLEQHYYPLRTLRWDCFQPGPSDVLCSWRRFQIMSPYRRARAPMHIALEFFLFNPQVHVDGWIAVPYGGVALPLSMSVLLTPPQWEPSIPLHNVFAHGLVLECRKSSDLLISAEKAC